MEQTKKAKLLTSSLEISSPLKCTLQAALQRRQPDKRSLYMQTSPTLKCSQIVRCSARAIKEENADNTLLSVSFIVISNINNTM